MRTVGVILTGGRSTRFGEDKSLYQIDGKPMYQHVVDLLNESGVIDDIVISTNVDLKHKFDNFEVIVDDQSFVDVGPLGGLYAVVSQYNDARFILVSCDTPYVPSSWIQKLVSTSDKNPDTSIITKELDLLHPTIALFNDSKLTKKLEAHLHSGARSMRSFFQHIDVKYLDIVEEAYAGESFININRKSELK